MGIWLLDGKTLVDSAPAIFSVYSLASTWILDMLHVQNQPVLFGFWKHLDLNYLSYVQCVVTPWSHILVINSPILKAFFCMPGFWILVQKVCVCLAGCLCVCAFRVCEPMLLRAGGGLFSLSNISVDRLTPPQVWICRVQVTCLFPLLLSPAAIWTGPLWHQCAPFTWIQDFVCWNLLFLVLDLQRSKLFLGVRLLWCWLLNKGRSFLFAWRAGFNFCAQYCFSSQMAVVLWEVFNLEAPFACLS